MILRHATDDDAEALNSFDVGDTAIQWLAEVAEIVAGLLGWRSDPVTTDEDRQVVIAERDGELVAVAAHVRLVGADGRSMPDHRYLMVTAVRADQQRTGLAQRLVESVLVDLRSQGVASVECDDPHRDMDDPTQQRLLRDIYRAAGGSHPDFEQYDRIMLAERRCAVLLTPAHVWTNPPGSAHKEPEPLT